MTATADLEAATRASVPAADEQVTYLHRAADDPVRCTNRPNYHLSVS